MKNYIKSTCLFTLLPFVACSGGLDTEVRRLRAQVNDIREMQSEQTGQIESLQSQVRTIQGGVEQMEFSQRGKVGDLDSLKNDISSLKKRVPPPSNVPLDELELDEAFATQITSGNGSRLMDGFTRLRDGDYAGALPVFQEALATVSSADSTVAPIVLFWLGVTYDGLLEFKNAVVPYNDIVTKFPKHAKAKVALKREARSFERLGDLDMANVVYEKLESEYGSGPKAATEPVTVGKKSSGGAVVKKKRY